MLKHLSIKNYALINALELDFTSGLTVVTGETGSGKSIMLGALQLLGGARYEGKNLRASEGKTVVEATFEVSDAIAERICREAEADRADNEIILRREISASGRSRAFINDSPVSLQTLSASAGLLFDIHSQHSNTEITSPAFQLHLLDVAAGAEKVHGSYTTSFARYVRLRREIGRIRRTVEANVYQTETLKQRLEDLKSLAPKRGELTSLEARFELLNNADRIGRALNRSTELLDESEQSVLSALNEVNELLSPIDLSVIRSEMGEANINDRLHSAILELKDIADSLNECSVDLKQNPKELEQIEQRILELEKGARRYGLSSPEELPDLLDRTITELRSLDTTDGELGELEKEAKGEGKKLQQLADELSELRRKAAVELSSSIEKKARPLGLSNLKIEIKIEPSKLTPEGQEHIEILCAFNKNQEPLPLAKRASGGEMSRLMLAIKALEASSEEEKVIIFDEIDTGVSGATGALMGRLMHDISAHNQVIAVTHLPQVAAFGDNHLKVYKQDDLNQTQTYVESIEGENRIHELAKMLSGTTLGDASLRNAEELMSQLKRKGV